MSSGPGVHLASRMPVAAHHASWLTLAFMMNLSSSDGQTTCDLAGDAIGVARPSLDALRFGQRLVVGYQGLERLEKIGDGRVPRWRMLWSGSFRHLSCGTPVRSTWKVAMDAHPPGPILNEGDPVSAQVTGPLVPLSADPAYRASSPRIVVPTGTGMIPDDTVRCRGRRPAARHASRGLRKGEQPRGRQAT
jgi:hypothetical protein